MLDKPVFRTIYVLIIRELTTPKSVCFMIYLSVIAGGETYSALSCFYVL